MTHLELSLRECERTSCLQDPNAVISGGPWSRFTDRWPNRFLIFVRACWGITSVWCASVHPLRIRRHRPEAIRSSKQPHNPTLGRMMRKNSYGLVRLDPAPQRCSRWTGNGRSHDNSSISFYAVQYQGFEPEWIVTVGLTKRIEG